VPLTEEEMFCDRGDMRTSLNVRNRNFIKYNRIQKFKCQIEYDSRI